MIQNAVFVHLNLNANKLDEMNTTCCYAVQDKVWVHDPDGNAWEIFFTKEDSDFESAGEPRDASLCCAPSSGTVAIELGSLKKEGCC